MQGIIVTSLVEFITVCTDMGKVFGSSPYQINIKIIENLF